MKRTLCFLFLICILVAASGSEQPFVHREAFVDKKGIIRWTDTKKEVALFGANYCLPSACDYRAAGLFTTDRKKVVDQDMAHFARMGWDALRLSFWGDWENSDKQGNLFVNDHLDVMDYVIAKARERGIYILLSPIVTYGSLWPDAMKDTASVNGLSAHFNKSELGTNPDAIAAQCNYWKQMLNHVNPYTGVALKEEPAILFLETINEPDHHSKDLNGSVAYINTMVEAIRSTGCKKLIFHNYSQDNKIGMALRASKIDGLTFAWYPTGLNSGHLLEGNYLRSVDDFPTMLYPDIEGMARIVYEFDSPDLNTGYMYPAMMRTFKSVGAQFATMFSYDMLVSAPYNQGWNTHLLNLVYTPVKAASAIISARAMKNLPLYKQYGSYPENTSFGDFKVNYDGNSSVMNSKEAFMYDNSTSETPQNIAGLKQLVGVGSSPVVRYEGLGIYFLDKVKEGEWRLEVYPDAVTVGDPFGIRKEPKVVIRLISRVHAMKVDLPGLGDSFNIYPVNAGNKFTSKAVKGLFTICPGVYVLTSGVLDKNSLPSKFGLIGFSEFVCPPDEKLQTQISVKAASEYPVDQTIKIVIQVADSAAPGKVELCARLKGENDFKRFNLIDTGKFNFQCNIPVGTFTEGSLEFYVEVTTKGKVQRFENEGLVMPEEKGYYTTRLVKSDAPLVLFNPEADYRQLSFTRIGDNIRHGLFKLVDESDKQKAFSLSLPMTIDSTLKDYTASLIISERILSRSANHSARGIIGFKAKGSYPGTAYLSLVEADGTTWMKKLELTDEWKEYRISPDEFTAGPGVKLPQAFPEQWDYWMAPASGRGGIGDKINLDKVERLLLSLRPENNHKYASDPELEIGIISLEF